MNSISRSALTVSILVSLVSQPVFAFKGDINPNAFKQEVRSTREIQVQGTLTCDLGSENTGQACDLLLHDVSTGRTYHLINGRQAMELLSAGTPQVAVTGRMVDPETLHILRVTAI